MPLLRTSRLLGGRYVTMLRASLERHPTAEAKAHVRRWLRSWATQRGALLEEAQTARGLACDASSLIREMDLACKYVWEIGEVTATPSLYDATIDWTPMDDAWADLDAAAEARIFWEETLPALARAYNSDLTLELAAPRWRGDPRTQLRVQTSNRELPSANEVAETT
ncbi:MAG: hypothetical protein H0T39_09335 [Actinobacteria bacterium]|nr:hypothetical protein [Actinomycetota bacterium]